MNLDKSTGIEVFVVAGDEGSMVDIEIFDDLTTALEYMSLLTVEENESTKAYHGVLMPADVLVPDIEGVQCFVLALEMCYKGHVPYLRGYVYESDCESDVDMLAQDIEQVINNNEFTAAMRITIEDVFVLYGHELEVCLSINPDSIEGDGVLKKSGEIAEAIKTTKTHEKELENVS
jgi:hypothetical protein